MLSLSNRLSWMTKAVSTTLLVSVSTQLHGAAFSLSEFLSSTSLARSRAGGAAVAEDATTVFTNPAGLTRLAGSQWLMITHIYVPSIKFKNRGTTDAFGAPMSGSDGGDAGVFAAVPNFFYTNTLSEQWSIGFGMNSPFGLSSEYDREGVGRYQSIESKLQTINLNPSVGFKVNKTLSIGAGISLQYAKANLSSALDFGAVCLSNLDSATCANLGMPTPQSADGLLELEGDDWSGGFNLGLLWTLNAHTRVGMGYRSKVKHTLEGDADFTNPDTATVFQPAFTDSQVSVPITLPEHFMVSIHHQWTPHLAVMADFTYTRWSRYEQLQINYDNPYQPDTIIPKNWKDGRRFSAGLDYTYNPFWRFQAGLAFEKGVIPADTFDLTVPVHDITWLSFGTHYQYSNTLSFGFVFQHIFYKDHEIHLRGAGGDTLHGEIESDSSTIGLQLNWQH